MTDPFMARRHINELRYLGTGLRRISEMSVTPYSILLDIVAGKAPTGVPLAGIPKAMDARIRAVTEVPIPPGHVRGLGTQRRIRMLVRNGCSRMMIAKATGLTYGAVLRASDPGFSTVLQRVAEDIDSAFWRLSSRLGPDDRARLEGRKRGWPMPGDIDEDELDQFRIDAYGYVMGFDPAVSGAR